MTDEQPKTPIDLLRKQNISETPKYGCAMVKYLAVLIESLIAKII